VLYRHAHAVLGESLSDMPFDRFTMPRFVQQGIVDGAEEHILVHHQGLACRVEDDLAFLPL
jgi:hypothetical protein